MRKILITGSTGMLGSVCVRIFREQYDVYGLSRTLNPELPKSKQFLFDLHKPLPTDLINIVPDIIIHTAALTDLNFCEENPSLAEIIHVDATRSVARLASAETVLFYISTDSVFDGYKGNYMENDKPNPLNVYASSKLKGELVTSKENPGRTTIVRTNMYGFNVPMKKSLAEWAFSEWKAGKKISGFTDIIFNAVFTGQLARIIKFLIEADHTFPVLNIASDTAISKFDFLEKFRIAIGIKNDLLSRALSTDFPVRVARPKDTSLNTSLLATIYQVPTLDQGIREWIEDLREFR